ncbi:MAG: hypothetical protein HKP57_00120 [Halobacteria archaeon]|nr:hypothetical protein [Halobacteria archaeon]
MHIIKAILTITLATMLFACEQQDSATAVDPVTGRECFESRRASLPPGTQYEGIDRVSNDRIVIRIMNGVDVTTLECGLDPDGSITTQTGQDNH